MFVFMRAEDDAAKRVRKLIKTEEEQVRGGESPKSKTQEGGLRYELRCYDAISRSLRLDDNRYIMINLTENRCITPTLP